MQFGSVKGTEKSEANIASLNNPGSQEALLAAAKRRDALAFETIVKHNQSRIFTVALRYTRIREDAEDVVQQTFQKAFIYLPRFEGKSSLSTWLTRIAINEALMLLRKSRFSREVRLDDSGTDEGRTLAPEMPDTSPNPEATYLRREEERILSAAIGRLRPGVRKAIQLKELEELTVSEIARRIGLSNGAVKARVFHGKRKLREKLRRTLCAKGAARWNDKKERGYAREFRRDAVERMRVASMRFPVPPRELR